MNKESLNYESTSQQVNGLTNIRKSLAIFSLTSCEGCQFELLSYYEHFNELSFFYDIKEFRLGQQDKLPGPFDVAIVEGSPEDEQQFDFLRKIRKDSKVVIAMGSCAHMGGIQSQRNSMPYGIFHKKNSVKSVPEVIKTDYIVPGCPISHAEMVKCLLDIYWDKKFLLPDTAVCFSCRFKGNRCLIKNDKPCLGPVTRDGCGAICPEKGEACLGCRGPLDQANFKKMRQILGTMLEKEEIENWLTVFGDIEQTHKKMND